MFYFKTKAGRKPRFFKHRVSEKIIVRSYDPSQESISIKTEPTLFLKQGTVILLCVY